MGNRFELVNESDVKELSNPFPNVRMIVESGNRMWCLRDFAIAIGYTQINGVMRLLTQLEKEAITSKVTACIRKNGRVDNKEMKYAPIEILNVIINRTTLNTDAVMVWKEKMQEIGGEAVKSELGISNKIYDAIELNKKAFVEEIVYKVSDKIGNTYIDVINKMQEDNRKFQLQLLDRIIPKEKDLKCTKYITDFVGGNKIMASQVNIELEKAGYLKRVGEGKDKHWEFTDIAKRLGIGEVVEERHYKTILYNEKANDIIEDMIGKVKENNSLLF